MALYQKLLQQAQGVAATPYTPYGGELVAPINAQQQQGIAGVNAAANSAQPYMNKAYQYAQDAAQPITQQQIEQYMSPYTKNVVDATQNQFNSQNAQQQQKLLGNAIAQGALGGNRVAVGQAALANQQQLAQAPVIAGLQNQGYQTGLNTALSQQQAMALGANSLGTLGVAGQNAALTGAGAQIGAGTLEQQTQQAKDAAAYQQFMQQQGYPFQTLQWLAGLGTGVGSQMGGTSSGTNTQTQPGPSGFSSVLGGLTGIGGLLGQSGAFGAAGWMAPMMAALATGGRVPVRAAGGVVPSDAYETVPETPETLQYQQEQLKSGHRKVHMFPSGTPELELPEGMARVELDGHVFHYDPRKISQDEISELVSEGRENEFLDLGPFPKEEVLKRLRGGEIPVAVVERHPDGTEVRAAAGTHSTAREQLAAMRGAASPGHNVGFEDIRQVMNGRTKGRAFGGSVQGFDLGGGVGRGPEIGAGPEQGAPIIPFGEVPTWVPTIGLSPGQTMPQASAPRGVVPQQSSSDIGKQMKDIGGLAKSIYESFGDWDKPADNVPLPGSTPIGQGGIGRAARGGAIDDNSLGWVPSAGLVPGRTMPQASVPELPKASQDTRGGLAKGLSDLGGLGKNLYESFQTANWDGGTPLPGGAPIGKGGIGSRERGGVATGEERDHGVLGFVPDSDLLFNAETLGGAPSSFGQGPVSRSTNFPKTQGVVAEPEPPVAGPEENVSSEAPPPPVASTDGVTGLAAVPTPRERPIMGLEPIAPERKVTRATSTGEYAPSMERMAAAHRSIESSNNYGALGPKHPKTGDRAYGAYQVMGANIPVWTKEVLGRAMTPEEFLQDKEAQDAVYKAKMGGYVNKYGVDGALRAWLGPAEKDFTGTSQEAYRNKFMAALNGGVAPQATGVAAADDAALPPNAKPAQHQVSEKPGFDWSEKNKLWPALTAAGFAMMASRSPYLGNAIGEGGLAGVQTFENLKQTEAAQRLSKTRIDLEARKLGQQADRWEKEDARKDKEFNTLSAKDKATLVEKQNLTAADRAKLAVDQARLEEQRRANDMKLREPVKIGQDPVRGTDIYAIPKTNPNGGIDYHKVDPKSGRIDPVPMNDTNNPLKQSGGPGPFRPGIAPQGGGAQNVGGFTPVTEASLEKAAASAPPPEVRAAFPPGSKQARNEAFLAEIAKEDPRYAASLKAIANYQISPNQFSLRNNRKERAMGDVMMYDPTYDQREYNKRNTAVTRFSSGKQGDAIRSFGVSLEHLQTADELGKALKNGDVQALNKFTNYVKTQFGAEAQPNFNAAKQIVAGEINKMIVGGQGTGGEREELQHQFNSASSPEQLAGVIETLKKLMVGQVKGLKQQYEVATGLRNFEEMLPPVARSELERLDSHGSSAAPAAGTAVKVAPADEAFLKKNPAAKAAIDKKYGPGTADRILKSP